MKSLCLAFCLCLSTSVFAHEGHGNVPGAVAAPHNGKILSLPELYLEVVKSDNSLKVYPFTHDLKPIPVSEVKISAKVELPKQKKTSAVITTDTDSWTISVDSKEARRFTLFLNAEWKGKKGSTKYTIEQ